eukprot:CAMPEP_0170132576 /NCGR_PEP_ID=MMETSP0033_2-20121228/449_1 /TAXON_ID=195969 /ORGANISM="Dolichomastix tenuilepis, Strain CCMP3274" /LENGTH=189 /DNA_ID=CAMNT_0010367973 /DNA_START=154 /DNA_END=723 /DNA_ORIENTATION=+
MSRARHVYSSVITDCINSLRSLFEEEGLDESVLQQLQSLWWQNLDASGALLTTLGPVSIARVVPVANPLARAVDPAATDDDGAAEEAVGEKRKAKDGGEGGSAKRSASGGAAAASSAEEGDEILVGPEDTDAAQATSLETANLIVAQRAAVRKTRTKLKMTLGNVLVHINGRDFPFASGTAEIERNGLI